VLYLSSVRAIYSVYRLLKADGNITKTKTRAVFSSSIILFCWLLTSLAIQRLSECVP
jgi:hypothetical protein